LVTTDAIKIPMSSNKEDVKAIGMGKTQVANGMQFNAMMYNPALLAHERISFDAPNVQASLPWRSFDALAFLRDHSRQFSTGGFLKQIKDGVRQFKNAQTLEQQLEALRMIQEGLAFPNELQNRIGGTADAPKVHGLSVIPGLQAQIGNWGFAAYGVAQTGFMLQSGQALGSLAKLNIPRSLDDVTPEMLINLLATVDPLLDENGDLRSESLPEAFAVSYLDLVGAGGYAFQASEELSLGATVKLLNRRFSSKRIAPENYANIYKQLRQDFSKSITGVTMDFGATYDVRSSGTRIGVSVQNVIPVQTIQSNAHVNYTASEIVDFDRDEDGNPIITNGQAAVVAGAQRVRVTVPLELEAPLLANIGVLQPLTDSWDVELDWADIAGNDTKYETTIERMRLGTEYRFTLSGNGLVLAVRAGLAEKVPTFGAGVNVFDIFQLDAAYARDTFLGENSIFAQVKLGM
jgi:hypothetical protein